MKEMSGFNFGETIKIEVTFYMKKQSNMQFKLVDSIQWMDEREEHVLRQLRLISQKCGFYLL